MNAIDNEEYRENLEDLEAVEALARLRQEPLEFRHLEDFLEEYSPDAQCINGTGLKKAD